MKVKRQNVLELYSVLSQAQNVFGKPVTNRFRYAVIANLKACEEERKLVVEAFPYDPGFIEFDQKKAKIYDEANVHSQAQLDALSPEARAAVDERILKLRDEYDGALQAQMQIDKERNEFCQEEIDIKLYQVGIDDMPPIIASNDWEITNVLSTMIDPDKKG